MKFTKAILLSFFLIFMSIGAENPDTITISGQVLDFKVREEREFEFGGGGCDLLLHLDLTLKPDSISSQSALPDKIYLSKVYIFDSKEISFVYKIKKGKTVIVTVDSKDFKLEKNLKISIQSFLEIK